MFEVLTGKCGKNGCCVCTRNARIWRLVVVLGGYGVGKVVKVLSYKSVGRWSDHRWCHSYFYWHNLFRMHYSPGVDSDSNRNEYQEYFLGVKAAGA